MNEAVFIIFAGKTVLAWLLGYFFGVICRVIKQFLEKAISF